jgi:carboxylesterase
MRADGVGDRLLDRWWFRSAARQRFEDAHAARLPTDARGIVLGAETVRRESTSGRAALLLHGFNDTPQSMVFLADRLHAAGWSVLAPRLPGHGVRLPVMAREARATLWIAAVNEAYAALKATNTTIVVCGQSMGGALAVLLAAAHPDIAAVVLLAPYLSMPRSLSAQLLLARMTERGMPYRTSRGGERSIHDDTARAQALGPGIVTARMLTELRQIANAAAAALPGLQAPTLYVQSRDDNRIAPGDAERNFAALGSREKAQRWLTGCGHIITVDFCRDEVAQLTADWFARHAR